MRHEDNVAVVREWQEAANEQDVDRLLELSDPYIKIVGPRGSTRGRNVLEDWLSNAGLRLETLRIFARGSNVVMLQHGVWRSPETGETTGEADLATRFLVGDGRVALLARYDGPESLDAALEEARLSYEHEV